MAENFNTKTNKKEFFMETKNNRRCTWDSRKLPNEKQENAIYYTGKIKRGKQKYRLGIDKVISLRSPIWKEARIQINRPTG